MKFMVFDIADFSTTILVALQNNFAMKTHYSSFAVMLTKKLVCS